MTRQVIPEPVRRWLRDALPLWQRCGLVDADQAAGILDLYETDAAADTRRSSLLTSALLGLGALLLGLAALLLIGFNWEAMPRAAKLVTALAVIAATHGLGLSLRRVSRAGSESVFFLGCLLFGAGIWLIGQAFHLDAHYPDGVFWWAAGVLPFALALDSVMLHLLFVSLMALWAGMEVFAFWYLPPWWLFGWHGLPNGAFALPLFAAPGLAWAYRRRSPTGVGLYVALLAWWVVLQAFAWRFGLGPYAVFWIAGVGALLLLAAEAHPAGEPMAVPYRVWGAALVGGALLPMSSWWFWADGCAAEGGEAMAVALLLLAAIGAALFLLTGRGRVPAGLLGLAVALALWTRLVPGDGLVPALLGNVAMVGLALYLIAVGARDERLQPFGAGVSYFLLWAFARYIDLFGAAGGMLGAAGLFALCAVALFAVARFWGGLKRRDDEPLHAQPVYDVPAWVRRPADWLRDRARPVLLAAAGFQLAFLVAMIAAEAAPLAYGQTVTLRVRPVDPRDLFRGDYVILSYDVGQLTPDGGWDDRPVYVSLEPEADGKHWRGVRASHERPKAGPFLLGRRSHAGRSQLEFGIEAYYVQEGAGRPWEDAARSRKLSAEVAVSPWGKAKLRRLLIDP